MSSQKTVILITGANSGIGLETVAALARVSPDYEILLGTRSEEKGQKVLDELRTSDAVNASLKASISLLQLDITDEKSIAAAKASVERRFGRLDTLVNNAGIIVTHPCDTITNLRETFETNVFGSTLVTEAFESLLQKSTDPRLIYVSSEQGSITNRLDPSYKWKNICGDSYRMSKAALNMLAACHRFNYAEWNCKVCAFNPDFCVTNLTGEAGRAVRIEHGARDAKDPANALVALITGKRDAEFEKNGMLDIEEGELRPW